MIGIILFSLLSTLISCFGDLPLDRVLPEPCVGLEQLALLDFGYLNLVIKSLVLQGG